VKVNDLIVGATYRCLHACKGEFIGRIIDINGAWVDVQIVDGVALPWSASQKAFGVGEAVRVRDHFSWWERISG
jgi:hypothetical protein